MIKSFGFNYVHNLLCIMFFIKKNNLLVSCTYDIACNDFIEYLRIPDVFFSNIKNMRIYYLQNYKVVCHIRRL